MIRTIALTAALCLMAGAASAQTIDANGKCHDKSGRMAKMDVCKTVKLATAKGYKLDAKGLCHAPDGKMAKKELCK
jgi:hypothetical protein